MANSKPALVASPSEEPKPIKSTKKTPGQTNEWLIGAFNTTLAWIDVNLMPIICLAVLCAFAVLGFSTRLEHMTSVQKTVLSIAIVALLAVKTGRVIHKQ